MLNYVWCESIFSNNLKINNCLNKSQINQLISIKTITNKIWNNIYFYLKQLKILKKEVAVYVKLFSEAFLNKYQKMNKLPNIKNDKCLLKFSKRNIL